MLKFQNEMTLLSAEWGIIIYLYEYTYLFLCLIVSDLFLYLWIYWSNCQKILFVPLMSGIINNYDQSKLTYISQEK